MTTQEMIEQISDRTKIRDESKLSRELKSAYRWAARRVYNAQGGPDLMSTFGEEISIIATTRDYNLAANLDHEILGIKLLWLKFASDQDFTPMTEMDAANLDFIRADSRPAADPLIATAHPVLYSAVNFNQVRFAPAIPSGSTLRVDYFRIPVDVDPTTNKTVDYGVDLPPVFHDAIVSKATALIFNLLDDNREGSWETRAMIEFTDAINTAMNRVQEPRRIKPFRTSRRRFI